MSVHLNTGQIGIGTEVSLIMFQKKNDCPFRSLIKYFLAFKCENVDNLSLKLYNVCKVMGKKINVMDFSCVVKLCNHLLYYTVLAANLFYVLLYSSLIMKRVGRVALSVQELTTGWMVGIESW